MLKKVKSDISLDIIVSILTEEELRDIELCKDVIRRAFNERNMAVIKTLFEKIGAVFVFEDEQFRQKLVACVYSFIRTLALENVIEIGKDSVVGNIIVLYYFVKKHGIITPQKIRELAVLSTLKFIKDPFMVELIPSEDRFVIDLDERVKESNRRDEIEETAKVCEWLFANGMIIESEDTIKGILLLYENSESPELRFKGTIVSSLLKKRLDLFTHSIETIFNKEIKNEMGLIKNYSEIYGLLLKINVPVFFDFKNFRFNNVLYNGNFYFMKLLDMSGTERLLFPFEQIELDKVQKVYDLSTGTYVTPKGRLGRVPLYEIFSFRKVKKVPEVSDEQTKATRKLSETEIEEKIRGILRDQNITSHGPAERADIFTTKLFVNNENDLRNSAFIIKGKGYPKVYLGSVAVNILKAVELPVDIVFLVHTGSILDEAQEKFIKQCDLNRKMYCMIDPIELTGLLIAYNKINDFKLF